MCLICERIEMIKRGKNSFFVKELETGFVVLGDYQCFKGYTLFLCKEHVTELHQLPRAFKVKYLEEMSIVAEACQKAFDADKMNIELLGNGDAHVHFHIFPRKKGDTPIPGPVWWVSKDEMFNDKVKPTKEELERLKKLLRIQLSNLLNNYHS
ncbi:MAG: HIT family protein [Bacillales bacterium]|jgi:diadenosine tetraphosphate (Ap4A) HIT family hydrolase|nr:HIT family protein [Bacillales bacterium]